MKSNEDIVQALSEGRFEFTRHAFRRAVQRNISDAEIRQAGACATVIEEYPDDKYAPSRLLLGFTNNGRPLHIQVSCIESELVKIITIYEPDETEWVDYRKRR
jgi:hypothetical protein